MRTSLLLLLSVMVMAAAACSKNRPAPASSGPAAASYPAAGARAGAARVDCSAAVQPEKYWQIIIAIDEIKIKNLSGKLMLLRKFEGYSPGLASLFGPLDSTRDQEIRDVLIKARIKTPRDLEPQASCADSVQSLRDRFLEDNEDVREQYEVVDAKLKALEGDVAAYFSDGTGSEAVAEPASAPEAVEEPAAAPADDGWKGELEAKQYWNHRIDFARRMEEYLERVRDITQEYEGRPAEAREAMQNLKSEFDDELRNESMSPDYVPEGTPYASAEAREKYLNENPGIRSEFQEINDRMTAIRDDIQESARQAEQRGRPFP